MNEDRLIKEFESQLAQLKLLMSSFHPDTKFAQLVKQAMLEVHQDGEINRKLGMATTLLWSLVIISLILGVINIGLLLYLAE